MITIYEIRLVQGVCWQTKVIMLFSVFTYFFSLNEKRIATWSTKITLTYVLHKIIKQLLSKSKVSAIFLCWCSKGYTINSSISSAVVWLDPTAKCRIERGPDEGKEKVCWKLCANIFFTVSSKIINHFARESFLSNFLERWNTMEFSFKKWFDILLMIQSGVEKLLRLFF